MYKITILTLLDVFLSMCCLLFSYLLFAAFEFCWPHADVKKSERFFSKKKLRLFYMCFHMRNALLAHIKRINDFFKGYSFIIIFLLHYIVVSFAKQIET